MQHDRYVDAMYRTEELTQESPTAVVPIIFEAIVRQFCLAATYNRNSIVIAPHALYTRNDAVFVDAVTVSRNLVMAREAKLGSFHVAGLSALRLTARAFMVSDVFDRDAERYAGFALMMVEGG